MNLLSQAFDREIGSFRNGTVNKTYPIDGGRDYYWATIL